ncbi:putative C2 domain-containing protein [Senna tora]|uniref:Putative C2 domain-containing protein n=1 Tax=Senna tora TaxID=362788 RepID=A0A834U4F6_9FABA|nr:putative C2 domain-containing protein [Senna tora]
METFEEVQSPNHETEELTRMKNKKRLIVDDGDRDGGDHPTALFINIRYAEGIDNPINTTGRHYCVLYWLNPIHEFRTRVVHTLLNPSWNEVDVIPLPIRNHTHDYSGFLNLEILRFGSPTDPGPSSGVSIAGRARVPLPKEPFCEIVGRFGLVRPDAQGHKAEAGHIVLSMELTNRDNPGGMDG